MATLLVLTGPVLFVFALPVAFFEIWGGNIHLLLALAIVLGFRLAGTWSFVLLTKVTPGIGLLWFAARREWRTLAIALGATAAIVACRLSSTRPCGVAWIDLLLREASGTASAGPHPDPAAGCACRLPRCWRSTPAGQTASGCCPSSRSWPCPSWWGSLSVLIGCVALERERLETRLIALWRRIPTWSRARFAGRVQDLMPEPEA